MRGGLILAWAAGLGIISWRSVSKDHHPPMPGQLAGASGLFALLAILAEYQPAAAMATLTAWGFDLAALLAPGFLPGLLGGTTKTPAPTDPGGAPVPPHDVRH